MVKPIEVAIVEENEKFAKTWINYGVSASHQGSMMIEVVKLMLACGGSVPREGATGKEQLYRLLSPDEIIDRAEEIVEKTFERMAKREWIAEMPTIDSIRRDGSQPVGFTGRSG